MLNTKIIALAALAAFIIAPTASMAGEGAPKVSYAAKKKGHVAFTNKTEAETMAEDTTAINPADIEPAAGGAEPMDMPKGEALSKSMKLPRK
jgi:PBP1b-binding outer membrane lipoprotein LpoB